MLYLNGVWHKTANLYCVCVFNSRMTIFTTWLLYDDHVMDDIPVDVIKAAIVKIESFWNELLYNRKSV